MLKQSDLWSRLFVGGFPTVWLIVFLHITFRVGVSQLTLTGLLVGFTFGGFVNMLVLNGKKSQDQQYLLHLLAGTIPGILGTVFVSIVGILIPELLVTSLVLSAVFALAFNPIILEGSDLGT